MTPERRRVRGVHVTEHAIVRYLERHYGLDVDALLDEIVTAETARKVALFPKARIAIRGNLWLTVRDGTVVTVEPTDGRHKPANRDANLPRR